MGTHERWHNLNEFLVVLLQCLYDVEKLDLSLGVEAVT